MSGNCLIFFNSSKLKIPSLENIYDDNNDLKITQSSDENLEAQDNDYDNSKDQTMLNDKSKSKIKSDKKEDWYYNSILIELVLIFAQISLVYVLSEKKYQ